MSDDYSHYHDFCYIGDCNFFVTAKLFLDPINLEQLFFSNLHLSQNKNDYFYLDVIFYEPTIKTGGKKRKNKGLQIGESFYILYIEKGSTNKSDPYLEKEIKFIDKKESENYMFLHYDIKAKVKSEIYREYDLIFEIIKCSSGTLVYGRIDLHTSIAISSPFNEKFNQNLNLIIKKVSNNQKFIENVKITEIAYIRCNKAELFSRLSMMKLPPNITQPYSVEMIKGETMEKGNIFAVKSSETVQKFESINFLESKNPEKESIFSYLLLESSNKYPPYTYSVMCKRISDNKTLVVCSYLYASKISRNQISQLKTSVKASLYLYKKFYATVNQVNVENAAKYKDNALTENTKK